MKLSDGGSALSYNAQISADAAHGLFVSVAVTRVANDAGQLLPAVERIEERLQRKPEQMAADAGFTGLVPPWKPDSFRLADDPPGRL